MVSIRGCQPRDPGSIWSGVNSIPHETPGRLSYIQLGVKYGCRYIKWL